MAAIGSVITVSTRGRPEKFTRMAQSRIKRDGVTQLAAETSNGRQRRLLWQVRNLLAADPGLDVFGPSDHRHLGALQAYVAGTEAKIGIWVAEKFRKEHVKVLQDLNGRSDGIKIYAVRARLL